MPSKIEGLAIQVDGADLYIQYPTPNAYGTKLWHNQSCPAVHRGQFYDYGEDIRQVMTRFENSPIEEKLRQVIVNSESGKKPYTSLRKKYQHRDDEPVPKTIQRHSEVAEAHKRIKAPMWHAGHWWLTNALRVDFRYNPQISSPLDIINELETKGYKKVISDERPFLFYVVKFPEIGLYIEFPDADLAEIKKKQENLFPFVYWVPDHNLFGKMYTAHSIETGLGEGDPVEIANLEKAFNEHYEEGKRVFEAFQKKYERSEGDIVTELKDWDKVEAFMEGGGKKGWLSKLLG
jgi:hypothetical protein